MLSMLLLSVSQVVSADRPREGEYLGTTWQVADTSKTDYLLTATRDLAVPVACWQGMLWDHDNTPYIRERIMLDWSARGAAADQEWTISKSGFANTPSRLYRVEGGP